MMICSNYCYSFRHKYSSALRSIENSQHHHIRRDRSKITNTNHARRDENNITITVPYSYCPYSSSSTSSSTFSTTNHNEKSCGISKSIPATAPVIELPEPTWSVHSLELHKNHKPMSYDELKVLAKRAIIDLDYLSKTSKMNIDKLCQDLGNMMHMIHNVTKETTNEQIISYEKLTCQDIYDKPRGVTTAPIRTAKTTIENIANKDQLLKNVATARDEHVLKNIAVEKDHTNHNKANEMIYPVTENDDNATADELKENEKLWDQYIKPIKMRRVGGHYYFVIPTKNG
jgi:hypothetical protein